jgi:hypothetical protein
MISFLKEASANKAELSMIFNSPFSITKRLAIID